MIRYSHENTLLAAVHCDNCQEYTAKRYKPADGGFLSRRRGGVGFRFLTACSAECAAVHYAEQERTNRKQHGR